MKRIEKLFWWQFYTEKIIYCNFIYCSLLVLIHPRTSGCIRFCLVILQVTFCARLATFTHCTYGSRITFAFLLAILIERFAHNFACHIGLAYSLETVAFCVFVVQKEALAASFTRLLKVQFATMQNRIRLRVPLKDSATQTQVCTLCRHHHMIWNLG